MTQSQYTFGGLIAYAPNWISDTGVIEVFQRLDLYCPKSPHYTKTHCWSHDDNYLGYSWYECLCCHKIMDDGN